MLFTRTSNSDAETRLIGEALGRILRAGDCLLLDGPLGAGKTTLVRAIARGMGIDTASVASPTFVIAHEYPQPSRADGSADDGGALGAAVGGAHDQADLHPDLIHIDAYRLRDSSDLDSVGWDHLMARVSDALAHGRGAAMVIEWAERLGDGPFTTLTPARIRIEHISEEAREFTFDVPDPWALRPGLATLHNRAATTCPVTGAPVPPDSPTYPFASERARMADLYRWFSGSYQISRDTRDSDFDE